MRRDLNQVHRRNCHGQRSRKLLAKSADCLLLCLCLTTMGTGASDERLVNGLRLFATLIQRHARLYGARVAGSTHEAERAVRPHGTLMQIK